jgi:3-phenylpropionate/trans-cinnamate dioxygenase ferredoxin subunit
MAATEFVTVATTEDIPSGDRIVVELGRNWVAIFNVDGKYYAIEDVCPHDDGPLAEGELVGCVIECPRHGAKFDIRTGQVLAPPALVNVPSYQVRLVSNEIQIAPR